MKFTFRIFNRYLSDIILLFLDQVELEPLRSLWNIDKQPRVYNFKTQFVVICCNYCNSPTVRNSTNRNNTLSSPEIYWTIVVPFRLFCYLSTPKVLWPVFVTTYYLLLCSSLRRYTCIMVTEIARKHYANAKLKVISHSS